MDQLGIFFLHLADGSRFIAQVGAIETRDIHARLGHLQLMNDVGPHIIGGSGGEGDRGWVAKLFANLSQSCVVGTEIVTPLADAVGLIDDERFHLEPLQQQIEVWIEQPFRGQIKQPVKPRLKLVHHLPLKRGAE